MRRIALFFLLPLSIVGVLFLATTASATDYFSTSFILKDPVLFPAGHVTSAEYRAEITIGQIAIGTSTVGVGPVSEVRSGFEYFPFVARPVLTAQQGNAQVSLSWSAPTGFLGWTVSGYSVGQSTQAGGPYAHTLVGAITNTTIVGLTNGTAYYFVVAALDFFGNFIATSTEAGATPVVPFTSGGGGPTTPTTPIIPIIIPPLTGTTTPIIPIIIPPLTTRPPGSCSGIADLDCDDDVDIIDFSVMYYWFDKNIPPSRVDLQGDGTVNIDDFSVMAHYWTVIPPLTEKSPDLCNSVADLDCDGYVDIIDFSVMYYWFGKEDPPRRVDLQGDGMVDIDDFSVMAHYWLERTEIGSNE